ncbi:colorectal cancer associated 2 [Pungitius pungitius]|uniref:colorectal cancer associated 2 n=1 Tax=Pungitius pungitius TaxID=134920 RepID=UPI002E146373
MSDKPKVYQGVRVRTTVKELLQRLRAREDSTGNPKTISQDLQDLCASTFQSLQMPPFPAAAPPAAASSCGARDFQGEGSCSAQVLGVTFNDVPEQFGEVMLPGNGYTGHNNSNSNNNNNNTTGSSYSACLPASPAFPLTCCHALSSDADYFGMAPCSSPEPLQLCSPPDHGSYSPHDSFSSFSSSSSCYDSPTRIEACYRGPPPPSEHLHYQHCSLQDCFCSAPRWAGQQESFSAPEFPPYYPPGSGYAYTCHLPAEDNYFRSSEMCYNVL